MTLSHSLEDYLEAIWVINQNKKVVRAKDIVNYLGYRVSSVNNALKNLAKEGLIEHERYGYIEITEKGANVAAEIYKKHETLELFFAEVLQVDEEIAARDACNIEHYISDSTFRKFSEFIEFLKRENSNCYEEWRKYAENKGGKMKLSQLKPGQKGVIKSIEANVSMKQRFNSMGILQGEPVEVIKKAPLGDPVILNVKNYQVSLRKTETEMINVEVV